MTEKKEKDPNNVKWKFGDRKSMKEKITKGKLSQGKSSSWFLSAKAGM